MISDHFACAGITSESTSEVIMEQSRQHIALLADKNVFLLSPTNDACINTLRILALGCIAHAWGLTYARNLSEQATSLGTSL